jgi:phosphoribosylformylglycinamidine synthase PurS subunit
MKAQVFVRLKKSVLDPQGKAILGAVHSLGIADVEDVRQGKVFDLDLKTDDRKKAEEILKQVGQKLLANTVIEDFEVKLV